MANAPGGFVSPVKTGIRGRCPKCGEGQIFDGFLKYARDCAACGLNFESEDAGDGPAVFVIFLAGFIICPLALVFHIKLNAPIWLTMLVWAPLLILFCMAMLRPMRGILLNLQIVHDAAEGQIDPDSDD